MNSNKHEQINLIEYLADQTFQHIKETLVNTSVLRQTVKLLKDNFTACITHAFHCVLYHSLKYNNA